MTQPLKGVRVEFHILQSFPVTCLNRDDVGAPKSAMIGGVSRARVSSQCWKRQVRLQMQEFGIKLGSRTKRTTELFTAACLAAGANEAQAEECGTHISELLAKDTLLFISETEAKAFAAYAEKKGFKTEDLKVNELAKVAKKAIDPNVDGLDIALFGRMVAKVSEMNVEAAASFSHAISTHKVANDLDFFTALDDHKEEQGSAHMGTTEFNSATYYRYVSLDLGELSKVLEPENLEIAIEAFTKALFVAVPAARQTTQSGASPWEFARVLVRKGQRLQVPFETAISSQDGGYLQPSINALTSYIDTKEKLVGSLYGKIANFDWGLDENFSIDDLISSLKTSIK